MPSGEKAGETSTKFVATTGNGFCSPDLSGNIRQEVYIQPFPNGAGRWQVSTAGGSRPNWRKDGSELFFFSTDQQMMAVEVSQKGASLQLGSPHALFKATAVTNANGPYTLSPDGKKFVVNALPPQSITEPLTLITNWTEDQNH